MKTLIFILLLGSTAHAESSFDETTTQEVKSTALSAAVCAYKLRKADIAKAVTKTRQNSAGAHDQSSVHRYEDFAARRAREADAGIKRARSEAHAEHVALLSCSAVTKIAACYALIDPSTDNPECQGDVEQYVTFSSNLMQGAE